jgi:Ni/Fe-hydrogenase subunit HybB-like protein
VKTSPEPGRRLLTPFNVVAGIILAVGLVILAVRFTGGLAATTNLTDDTPWGLWTGFKLCGVALSAGGFVSSTAVYVLGARRYEPIVRPAILTGFLGYFLVVLGLLIDLGRPWRLAYPFFVQAGPSSALFEVGLCVALYLTVLFLESTPAAFEWLGWKRWRALVKSLTVGLTILGLILSTLHQSTLGALYTITPTRLHPLWYSTYLPVHFFVSAVAAGASMVIVVSALSQRVFRHQVELTDQQLDRLTLGLAKAASIVLAVYFSVKVVALVHDDTWRLLGTSWGAWYLTEIITFVVLPCITFAVANRERRPRLARSAAAVTVIGVALNRFNVSVIAFNWTLPAEARYTPHWMEIWMTVALVTFAVVAFRWIANRMPILYEHPEWKGDH